MTVIGRRHAVVIDALATPEAARWRVASPAPGWFRPSVTRGDLVRAGAAIGDLVVLGHSSRLISAQATGVVVDPTAARAVSYGETLVVLDPTLVAGAVDATATTVATAAHGGLVFVAPTSGRFYGRPGPGKPPFVSVGDVITAGHTICMLEVMKTFDRVTYGGPGLPSRARIAEVLVADETDVDAGTPLLRLEIA